LMGARRLVLAILCMVVGVLVCSSATALALTTHVASTPFGSSGSGAGEVSLAANSGLAVNLGTHDVYVADTGNARIDEFDQGGGFIRAWGFGVADGLPAFETCTLSCQAGIQGSAAGQFTNPTLIAVDNSPGASAGDVYVGDTGDGLVSKFSAAGVLIESWGSRGQLAGSSATGKGTLATGSPTIGSVTTATGAFSVGQEISAPGLPPGTTITAVGGGVLEVSQGAEATGSVSLTALQPFGELAGIVVDSAGTLDVLDRSQSAMFEFAQDDTFVTDFETPRVSSQAGLTVDSTGAFFKLNGEPSVEEFGPSGADIGQVTVSATSAGLALDPATGSLYVDDAGTKVDQYVFSPSGNVIEPDGSECTVEPNVGCSPTSSFGSGALSGAAGLAVGSSGILYAADAAAGDIAVFDQVVLPDVTTEAASNIKQTSVTFNGTVNPDSIDVSACRFEYGTSTSYGQSTPCVPDPGLGAVGVQVHADPVGLQSGTTYHYRLLASNAGGTNPGQDETFTTPPPAFDGEWVTNVASTSATLDAQINPLGLATTYHFEYDTSAYGTSAPHGTSLPVPDAEIGSGTADTVVSVHVQGLQAGTTYHYRTVASDELGTVPAPDQTFTTPRAVGGESVLPDGRAWELVSPPDKHGGAIEPISPSSGVVQASEDGGGITYGAATPTVANPPGNLLFNTRMLSTRGPGGWSSQDISTPNEVATGLEFNSQAIEYRLFSTDLSLALVEPNGETPPSLSSGASGPTMYLRNDADGTYQALAKKTGGVDGAVVDGSTPDLSHLVFGGEAGLDPNYPGVGGLYEWAGGHVQLVSVLPTGEAEGGQAKLGGATDVRHAISDDGSRVIWSSSEPEREHLYIRDMMKGETIQLDIAQGSPEPNVGEAHFQTASSDGSRVFFTDTQQLTPDSHAESQKPDLYGCQVREEAGKLACRLVDLTKDAKAGESADVQGMVSGTSEDGSYVYFVANGVLAPDATSGHCATENASPAGAKCNLYEVHYNGTEWESPTFIVALSSEDTPDWGESIGGTLGLDHLTSRVSPNGRYLAFMSDRSLTGYDNLDANSPSNEPHPDEEVFLYDVNTARLVCASCSPTGARPAGVFDLDEDEGGEGLGEGLLVDPPSHPVWVGRWLAASVPGWTPSGEGLAVYQSRYLSSSGRLFFNSADALVPQDVNGKEDVYEYEPEGEGSCKNSSATFGERSGGCVGLISSGTSGEESAFLDASASGDDVFFLTASRLVGQDVDTALDVYDAHVCGAEGVACEIAAVPPPPCTTADSCRQAISPQPAIFGAPSSETFSGSVSLSPTPTTAVKSTKSLTRAQKLAKALKTCKSKPRSKRKSCELQARKKYGPAHKAKKANRRAK
jgi:WD40-like Beta Propeller Repeat